MTTFAPTSRCGVAWCRVWHLPGDTPGHRAQIAVWRMTGYEVEMFLVQRDPHPPVVRIARVDEHGQRIRDLDPKFAPELADVLEELSGRMLELIAALRTAAEELRP